MTCLKFKRDKRKKCILSALSAERVSITVGIQKLRIHMLCRKIVPSQLGHLALADNTIHAHELVSSEKC